MLMKKILLFLMLIPILASCERDYTKYKLIDCSDQTKIEKHLISMGKKDSIRCYAIANNYDELIGGWYTFKNGDTINIYEYDNKFIASHIDVSDLHEVREYMRNYTQEKIKNGVVIWVIVITLFLLAIPCAIKPKNNIVWIALFVIGIEIFAFCYCNTDTGIEYSNISGTITKIDKNIVTIENNKQIPLYSNCDIIKKRNISSGDYIYIYSYKDTFFPSSKKLPSVVKSYTMFYPHTHLYYPAIIIGLFALFVFVIWLTKLCYIAIRKR